MKKVKVSLLAVAAIMLGVFSSAFTTPSSTAVDDGWFLYNGSGPLDNPSSYTYTGSIASCNSNSPFLCDEGHPSGVSQSKQAYVAKPAGCQ